MKIITAIGLGILGVGLTLGGAYAALNATASNTSAQTVGSGVLKLILNDNGAGFTQAVANLAPTDVVNRYVDVANTGTIDGRALTLGVVDANATKLSTDAVNGLHVSITQCSGSWNPTAGTCGGGITTPLVSNAALSALSSTPVTLVPGAVPAGSVLHFQVSLNLPDQLETTVNGVLPTNTIQGLSATLTWTFTASQRAGTTTNS